MYEMSTMHKRFQIKTYTTPLSHPLTIHAFKHEHYRFVRDHKKKFPSFQVGAMSWRNVHTDLSYWELVNVQRYYYKHLGCVFTVLTM